MGVNSVKHFCLTLITSKQNIMAFGDSVDKALNCRVKGPRNEFLNWADGRHFTRINLGYASKGRRPTLVSEVKNKIDKYTMCVGFCFETYWCLCVFRAPTGLGMASLHSRCKHDDTIAPVHRTLWVNHSERTQDYCQPLLPNLPAAVRHTPIQGRAVRYLPATSNKHQ